MMRLVSCSINQMDRHNVRRALLAMRSGGKFGNLKGSERKKASALHRGSHGISEKNISCGRISMLYFLLTFVRCRNRNWLEFLAVVDAAFADVTPQTPETDKVAIKEGISKAADLFSQVAEEDMRTDRSGLLALLELERRSREHGISSGLPARVFNCHQVADDGVYLIAPTALNDLLEKYFTRFGDKACCFEDLRPYIAIDSDDLTRWTSFLESQSSSFVRIDHSPPRLTVNH